MPQSKLTGVRLARTVALAVIIGIGLFNLFQAAANWTLSDAAAYWNAALRLREGEALYPLLTNVDASEVYRYAPWFAWATVPFIFLPVQLAGALWSLVLLAASAVALVPLVRARAWLLVALFAPILIGISAVGNVQPLLVAALVWGVDRRGGPLTIGLAASLKIFPILFAAVYVGRREWGRAALSLAVAALLWAPALLYDLRGYATDAGQAASLYVVPLLWALVVAAGVVVTLRLARTRFAWLAAAITVVISLPRLFVYDVTYLVVGVVRVERRPPVA
ncbi:MAG TPA: glycosyltransferase 87 family protein [Gemmatimonadales bacterium]|nr:glycosyltransferase 87 family protein [Gemmatimonadales bacterium]HLE58689.1 glycosyltransferase 87 family protein [Candidatus Limnocylindria bacterium]